MVKKAVLKKTALKKWSRFAAGLLCIVIFVFWLAPALQQAPFIAEIHHHSNEQGIDASALFYTEVDCFGDADVAIRDSMKY